MRKKRRRCKSTRSITIYNVKAKDEEAYTFVMESLFSTITNANFDKQHFLKKINQAIEIRDRIKENVTIDNKHDAATWHSSDEEEILKKATQVGFLAIENEDIRSLQSLLIFGLKGIAAYADHAYVLGEKDEDIFKFMTEALVATTKDLSIMPMFLEKKMKISSNS